MQMEEDRQAALSPCTSCRVEQEDGTKRTERRDRDSLDD